MGQPVNGTKGVAPPYTPLRENWCGCFAVGSLLEGPMAEHPLYMEGTIMVDGHYSPEGDYEDDAGYSVYVGLDWWGWLTPDHQTKTVREFAVAFLIPVRCRHLSLGGYQCSWN